MSRNPVSAYFLNGPSLSHCLSFFSIAALAITVMQNLFHLLFRRSMSAEMPRPRSICEDLQEVDCIDKQKFVPLDSLESVITPSSVAAELRISETARSDLAKVVTEQANKVFAALLFMSRPQDIEGLLNEGLRNQHLPLLRDETSEALKSWDGNDFFPFEIWTKAAVHDFQSHKQWLVLAPVLETGGQLFTLDTKCPLPFIGSNVVDHGAAGIVHFARVHKAHQRGFDAETFDLQVAVKQFFKKGDFNKENETLQKIKVLQHKHIIRHLVSIDKGDTGYTVFPWADRGNLHQYWADAYVKESSTVYALWALQQMQGLASAVDLLHQKFKCRHGDLKPGNILCFTQGSGGSDDRLPLPTLKIADFGISRIHIDHTMARTQATTTVFLTVAYQGPEVEFEKIDDKNPLPRSRKYDVWSLGCVYLEFLIWLLYGSEAVNSFDIARGTTGGSKVSVSSSPWYEVTDKAAKTAKVHQLVTWTISHLQNDPRCMGETVLTTLIGIIRGQMLEPDVDKRPSAGDISHQLEELVQKGEKYPDSLLHTCSGESHALDFSKFKFKPLTVQ